MGNELNHGSIFWGHPVCHQLSLIKLFPNFPINEDFSEKFSPKPLILFNLLIENMTKIKRCAGSEQIHIQIIMN